MTIQKSLLQIEIHLNNYVYRKDTLNCFNKIEESLIHFDKSYER
jgi:hypothetical protein